MYVRVKSVLVSALTKPLIMRDMQLCVSLNNSLQWQNRTGAGGDFQWCYISFTWEDLSVPWLVYSALLERWNSRPWVCDKRLTDRPTAAETWDPKPAPRRLGRRHGVRLLLFDKSLDYTDWWGRAQSVCMYDKEIATYCTNMQKSKLSVHKKHFLHVIRQISSFNIIIVQMWLIVCLINGYMYAGVSIEEGEIQYQSFWVGPSFLWH